MNPSEIANGYENALDKTLEILPSLVVKKADDLRDAELVQKYLKSAVMSKQYDNVDFITQLVAKACGRPSAFLYCLQNMKLLKFNVVKQDGNLLSV